MSQQQTVLQCCNEYHLEAELFEPVMPIDSLRSQYVQLAESIVRTENSKNNTYSAKIDRAYQRIDKAAERIAKPLQTAANYVNKYLDFCKVLKPGSLIDTLIDKAFRKVVSIEDLNCFAEYDSQKVGGVHFGGYSTVRVKSDDDPLETKTVHMDWADYKPSLWKSIVTFLAVVGVGSAGVTAAASHGSFVFGQPKVSSVHQTSSVPQIYLTCSSTPLNINIKNNQWSDAWKDAKVIDLVNYRIGLPYEDAGKTGFAYLGLKCDPKWLYGYVTYMPPPDENGHRNFIPVYLATAFDTNDDKASIHNEDDHLFLFISAEGITTHNTGLGVENQWGGWSFNIQPFKDSSVANFHLSITKTPFFSLPPPLDMNPLYQFQISREKLIQNDIFGLYVKMRDDHLVSKTNNLKYYATFPATSNLSKIEKTASLWPDIHLSDATTQTTTSLSSTTQSPPSQTSISSHTTSPTTEVIVPQKGPLDNVEQVALVGTTVFLAGLGIYGYTRHRKSKLS